VNPSAEVGGMLSRSRSISQDNFQGSLLEPLCGLAIEHEKHGLKRGDKNAPKSLSRYSAGAAVIDCASSPAF